MQHVRRAGLIAQVTDQLRADIANGTWPVGTKIPNESELCERTGTGRNTVREAVQSLVHTGMLERRQGSGTFVVATNDIDRVVGSFFATARQRDVVELRRALDVTAASLAAQRRDDDDIATLLALLDERRELWERDHAAAIEADVALHRAIVAATHNSIYLDVYDWLLPSIQESILTHTTGTGMSYHDEHATLVHAVVSGDSGRAATAARRFFSELAADHDVPQDPRQSNNRTRSAVRANPGNA